MTIYSEIYSINTLLASASPVSDCGTFVAGMESLGESAIG